LASALAQTHSNIEVIVADNRSEDETAAFMETICDPRVIKVRHAERLPMMANWNSCLKLASGEYFLLLSDDDYLEATAIEFLLMGFSREIPEHAGQASVGMVYGVTKLIDESERVLRLTRASPLLERAEEAGLHYFLRHRDVYACSCLLRTEDLKTMGGYGSSGAKLAVDAYAWSYAALKRGYVAFVPQCVSAYRMHSTNETSSNSISIWVYDLESLVRFWGEQLRTRNLDRAANRLAAAGREYVAWTISTLINKAAHKTGAPGQALRKYHHWRSRFFGVREWCILLQGILRLLLLQTAGLKLTSVGAAFRISAHRKDVQASRIGQK
jgi:glycosyltransferase involved in cell wall biosynthesis